MKTKIAGDYVGGTFNLAHFEVTSVDEMST